MTRKEARLICDEILQAPDAPPAARDMAQTTLDAFVDLGEAPSPDVATALRAVHGMARRLIPVAR